VCEHGEECASTAKRIAGSHGCEAVVRGSHDASAISERQHDVASQQTEFAEARNGFKVNPTISTHPGLQHKDQKL